MARTFQLELVTAEQRVVSEDAEFVKAPGLDGELGVMANHLALLTPLRAGEVKVVYADREDYFFVSGGFLEVLPDKVVILADAAERADDISQERAEEARRRAQELLQQNETDASAAAALERATMRLRVAEIRRRRHPSPPS